MDAVPLTLEQKPLNSFHSQVRGWQRAEHRSRALTLSKGAFMLLVSTTKAENPYFRLGREGVKELGGRASWRAIAPEVLAP
jgi:hypothetical protein